MLTPPTYPGVYVEERPSSAHRIAGVSTSVTAFVGRTVSGPTDAPTRVTSVSDFERRYGGLSTDCPLTYAVRHFFQNGGAEAVVARIVHRDATGVADESAPITDADITEAALEVQHRGLWLLDQCDTLNLICIPPLAPGVDVAPSTWNTTIRYAAARRAFVIVDPPATWTNTADVAAAVDQFVTRDSHAALYFPRVLAPDPLAGNRPRPFAPCGAVAGIYARTDTQRGVWKAAAGLDANLLGITDLTVPISDTENGPLNRLAIDALRRFPGAGVVVWGARTLAGTDSLASEWKYVNVRRLALFLEESIYRGLQWVAFEPNGEPLWAQIRVNLGAFLQNLFRQGAFQGTSPREAYFVKCDRDTTTQTDIDLGIVNVTVGFAPLKPAEFVIARIALWTADAEV